MTKEDEVYLENLRTYIKSLDVFISQQTNGIEDNNWEIGYLNREISLKQDKIRLNYEANALMRESIKQAEIRKEQALTDILHTKNRGSC